MRERRGNKNGFGINRYKHFRVLKKPGTWLKFDPAIGAAALVLSVAERRSVVGFAGIECSHGAHYD
jgi:hypothetical protein